MQHLTDNYWHLQWVVVVASITVLKYVWLFISATKKWLDFEMSCIENLKPQKKKTAISYVYIHFKHVVKCCLAVAHSGNNNTGKSCWSINMLFSYLFVFSLHTTNLCFSVLIMPNMLCWRFFKQLLYQ